MSATDPKTAAPTTTAPKSTAPNTAAPTALTALHVDWDDPRALALREAMDVEMTARYADKEVLQTTQAQDRRNAALAVDPASVLDTILLVDTDGTPLAHAALRDLHGEWEMKRVIVVDGQRGRGIGAKLMAELDESARRGGASRIILQTGDRQPDAVRLYERFGYTPIPVYEPYVEAIPFSLCYEKRLS